jgi:hypothetical protein
VNKCLANECLKKHKCFYHFEKIGFKIKESTKNVAGHGLKCNEIQAEECRKEFEKVCENLCPIDCIKDEYYLESIHKSNDRDNNFKRVLNIFWYSGKPFVSYEETANMLLLDYFTYIGGLFGLWFGICLENLMDLMLNNVKILKQYLKVKSKIIFSFLLLFLKSFWVSLLNCFICLTKKFFNSFKLFGLWFGICLKSLMDLIVKSAKAFAKYLKVLSKMFFSFILLSLKLFYIYLLYCINWLIYIIIKLFVHLKGIIRLFSEKIFSFQN